MRDTCTGNEVPCGLAFASLGITFCSHPTKGQRHRPIIHMIAETLSHVWDLEVLCPCTNGGEDRCVGHCVAQIAQALGISMTVGAGVGMSSTHLFYVGTLKIVCDFLLQHAEHVGKRPGYQEQALETQRCP